MTLVAEDIDLLRASFAQLAPREREVAAMFYDRLFELEPSLRRLFTRDKDLQGAKLMSMLGAIVARIHDLDALAPMVGDLARRHLAYSVRAQHHHTLGEALLWTLSRALGARFTPEAEIAWCRAYAALAAVMRDAAWPETQRQ
jgi:hemoglobin-like flavoprotein